MTDQSDRLTQRAHRSMVTGGSPEQPLRRQRSNALVVESELESSLSRERAEYFRDRRRHEALPSMPGPSVGRPRAGAIVKDMSSTIEPGTKSRSTSMTRPGDYSRGQGIPLVLPSAEYRDYTTAKQKESAIEPVFSYGAYDPLGQQKGKHRQFGQQVSEQEYREYPDPTFTQLGQSDPGYDILHPSEEDLQIDSGSGKRAVYGVHEGQPVHGPAEWQHYYTDWDQIGDQYSKPIQRDEALRKEELEFCEKYGFYFQTQLGRGSYGEVWAVTATRLFTDSNTGRYYDKVLACKVLTLPKFKKPGDSVQKAVHNMLFEADLQQKLKHTNIVNCEHVFHIHDEITGFPFCRCLMFMELCSGDLKSLIDTLPAKHMNEGMAFIMFRDVCNGLQYMHDQNVCHLDIKIHNVMYIIGTTIDVYKLADFGISKQYGPGTVGKVRGTVGTRLYMAPELLGMTNYMSASKPIDIYCLGLLLAECLAGRARFKRMLRDLENWSDQVQQQWGVGEVCADLLARMTDTDPSKRPTIEEESIKQGKSVAV